MFFGSLEKSDVHSGCFLADSDTAVEYRCVGAIL